MQLVSGYHLSSCSHRRDGAAVLFGRKLYGSRDRFCRDIVSVNDMFQLNAAEGARVFVAALGAYLQVIRGYLFAFFAKNRNDVGGSAAPQARDKQLQRTGSGFAPSFDIDSKGVAAGCRG